jgi:CubicO group peptidase (beta-lactamase class C family)
MTGLDAYRPRLAALVRDAVEAHGVPGAAVGVLLGTDTAVATAGVANVTTGVAVTPDTLFQVGSLTKLYTATLVLQAHSAGLLALDEPVRAQLQEFSVADPGATLEITPRHLLTHTSGIAGDHLHDTGANQDALQRYVATLAALGQVHAPDEAYSFCNTGFGVLGRLIEVVAGGNFDQVLRRRLAGPLGAGNTWTLPQHLLLRQVAVGHVQTPGAPAVRQPRWTLTRSNGPMGGIVCTAEDLLTFARMHLESGSGPDGNEVLPSAAVELMTESHVETPVPGEAQALGWTRRMWGDVVCLAQDADTFGQRAFLRVVPDARFALSIQANSPLGAALARDVMTAVAADLVGLPVTGDLAVNDPPDGDGDGDGDGGGYPDAEPFLGTYGRLHQRLTVSDEAGDLVLATEPSGVLARLGQHGATSRLRPVRPAAGVFAATDAATGVEHTVAFTGGDETHARYVHVDGRLHRRMV